MLPREMLYIADEAFFVGTAAEITPIRSADKITSARGAEGRSRRPSRARSSTSINGEKPDRHGWLTYVYPGEPRQAVAAGQARPFGR